MLCPCHSHKKYLECCQPFHNGETALTPLQLMRSRYAAYALGLLDYLMDTTDSNNPQFSTDRINWSKEISFFCDNTLFQGLEILEYKDDSVTFKAILSQNNQDISFSEKSLFIKREGRWYYLKKIS